MNKYVITGATSMIGMSFLKYAKENNIEVLAIIRKDSKKRDLIPKVKNIKILECNLDELDSIKEVCEPYDVFLHLAWGGFFEKEKNDMYVQNLNVKYTLDAVNLAKRLGCKRFIGAGSQAEYGRVEGLISPNTKTNPEIGYGMAKLCAGLMSRNLANQLGMEHVWARIFSIYGPYDKKNTMIMSSVISMFNGKSPDYTKAEQMWDYLYVEDCAKALYLLGEKGQNNQIYCIGSGKQRMLKDFIEEVRNQINPEIKLNLGAIAYSSKQVMNLCADIKSLNEDTGFTPTISFEEGIRKTIDWYKESMNNEKN